MSRIYHILLWASSFFGGPFGASSNDVICQQIDKAIPGRIDYASSSAYTIANSQYYSGQESELKPSCIFTPQDASEISQFLKLVTATTDDAASGEFLTKVAVRGGGHSVWTGAANIDGGITIDMRGLDSVVLSDDRKVASIGAGAIWSQVYPQIEPYNLTVAGGRVDGVGVGGFLLGGGISYLSRKHGWGADTVHGYEVVLASGEVIYATADSHPDLFLALKGGSNNFGIVTRFDMATFPNLNMWGGTILFEYSQALLDTEAKAFSSFMEPKNFDDAASLFVAFFYLEGTWIGGNVLFYVEPVDNPPVHREFTSIPSPIANTLRVTKVSEVATEQPYTLPPDKNRAVDIVVSFKNPSAAVYLELFESWEAGTKALSDVEGMSLSLLIQPHPVSEGRNSLGLPPGGKDLVMSVITVSYSHASDDDKVQGGMEAIIEKHVEILQRAGVYIPFQYLNYADKASQDPIGSYGQDVKARLQAVSKKYDPSGFFQTGVPGGFKLFEEDSGCSAKKGVRDEL